MTVDAETPGQKSAPKTAAKKKAAPAKKRPVAAKKGASSRKKNAPTRTRPVPREAAHSETLESDTKELLRVLGAMRRGNLSVRMREDKAGAAGKVADALNDILEQNARLASELQRVRTAVGKEGRLTQRASVPGAVGAYAESVEAVNSLIGDLVQPTFEVSRVITSVARGDLTQAMSLELDGQPIRGEFLRTAKTVNTMVDQLRSFSSEVTRVAREVGTEGRLGGQAKVKGVAGTWKDLTESVNSMASNLTNQVRNIAEVTTAVAGGDLSKKVTVAENL